MSSHFVIIAHRPITTSSLTRWFFLYRHRGWIFFPFFSDRDLGNRTKVHNLLWQDVVSDRWQKKDSLDALVECFFTFFFFIYCFLFLMSVRQEIHNIPPFFWYESFSINFDHGSVTKEAKRSKKRSGFTDSFIWRRLRNKQNTKNSFFTEKCCKPSEEWSKQRCDKVFIKNCDLSLVVTVLLEMQYIRWVYSKKILLLLCELTTW